MTDLSDEKTRRALERAAAANALKRYEDGLREAQAALQLDPSLEDGYGYAAQAQLGLKQPARALELARNGLGHHPESEWLNRAASLAARTLGFNTEALSFADEAVRLSPGHSLGHEVRADALAALLRRTEARAAYEKAIELAPENASHYADLGSFLLDFDPAAALVVLRKSLELDPTSARTHNNLGVALLKLKRAGEAALAFKTAVRLDPTLKVAKENVHVSVTGLLGKRVLWTGGLFSLLALVRILALAREALVLVLPILAFALVSYLLLKRWNNARLRRKLDPELLRLYEQIDADLKAKRL